MTGNASTVGPGSGGQPRAQTMPGQRLVNLVVRALLRTPGLGRVVGRRLVTLYVVGRKSKRRYAIPVAYLVQEDDLLIGTSFAWVRNLRTGEPVAIRLRGKLRRADVQTYTQETEVVWAYAHMARVNPTFAKFNNIHMDRDGEPDRHDLELAWLGGARAIRLAPR
jgi:deazaflavin-dependent oxidoreductase (nitroreductase family)